jgi:hypothetical protein
MDRAFAPERGMHGRQKHLARAIALVGIVANGGDRTSDGGGEVSERARGQRERRRLASQPCVAPIMVVR